MATEPNAVLRLIDNAFCWRLTRWMSKASVLIVELLCSVRLIYKTERPYLPGGGLPSEELMIERAVRGIKPGL